MVRSFQRGGEGGEGLAAILPPFGQLPALAWVAGGFADLVPVGLVKSLLNKALLGPPSLLPVLICCVGGVD